MASTLTTCSSRSRITLNEKHFKVIFNNIEHSIFSAKNQKIAITAAGNTELCEIVDVEPKAQCRACLTYWDVGIVYCTCGHFLRDDTARGSRRLVGWDGHTTWVRRSWHFHWMQSLVQTRRRINVATKTASGEVIADRGCMRVQGN